MGEAIIERNVLVLQPFPFLCLAPSFPYLHQTRNFESKSARAWSQKIRGHRLNWEMERRSFPEIILGTKVTNESIAISRSAQNRSDFGASCMEGSSKLSFRREMIRQCPLLKCLLKLHERKSIFIISFTYELCHIIIT